MSTSTAGFKQSRHPRLATFIMLSVILPMMVLVTSGCGSSEDGGPVRYRVSGTVTFDGNPVPAGTIYFQPAPGNPGPQGFATIVDGEYDTADSGKGTVGGAHSVRIEGADASGTPIFVPHFEDLNLSTEASTHEFDVPASAADGLQTDAEPV